MKVLVYTRTKRQDDSIEFVSFDELLERSDIVSVHCPLNESSKKMFCEEAFSKFRDGAYFINTARGGVIDEVALVNAVKRGKISGAAIDVLEYEPMREDCILFGVDNITITPHIAWAPYETRVRLLDIVSKNLEQFIAGNPQNVVS